MNTYTKTAWLYKNPRPIRSNNGYVTKNSDIKYRIREIFRGRKLSRLLKHQTIRGKTFAVPAPLYTCLVPQIYI